MPTPPKDNCQIEKKIAGQPVHTFTCVVFMSNRLLTSWCQEQRMFCCTDDHKQHVLGWEGYTAGVKCQTQSHIELSSGQNYF